MTLALPDGRLVVPGNHFELAGHVQPEPAEVTVVIPYYDAQRQLDLVFAGLRVQTHPPARLEVIVADDGSPKPPSLAAAQGLSVTVVSQERHGFRAAAARNLGASVAAGTVLCFLDGDTIPTPGYVAALARLPTAVPDALVVGRREHADFTGWTPDRVTGWLGGAGDGPPASGVPAWLAEGYARSADLRDADDRSFRYVISAVLGVAASLFREVDGFDPSFTRYGGEDWDLGHRAWNAGAVLAHVPAALAWHDGPEWAERGADRQAKNAETLALAARILQRETRARNVLSERRAVVASVDNVDWSDAATVITADSVLGLGDVTLWLSRPVDYLMADPRVQVGAPGEGGETLLVDVASPCVFDAAGLVSALREAARLTVVDDAGVLLRATAMRALRRASRWAGQFPGRDLLRELFPVVTAEAGELGVRRLPAEPDLAGYFAGDWGAWVGRA